MGTGQNQSKPSKPDAYANSNAAEPRNIPVPSRYSVFRAFKQVSLLGESAVSFLGESANRWRQRQHETCCYNAGS